MKRILIIISCLFLVLPVFGQKQSSPYFEFSYNCKFISSNFDSKKSTWTYSYEDSVNDVVIIIDYRTKETYWGDKGSIDAMVGDYGNMKITAGYFQDIYALITNGKENDGRVFKSAMFAKSKHVFYISVLSPYSDSVKKAYNQIEKTFVFK